MLRSGFEATVAAMLENGGESVCEDVENWGERFVVAIGFVVVVENEVWRFGNELFLWGCRRRILQHHEIWCRHYRDGLELSL